MGKFGLSFSNRFRTQKNILILNSNILDEIPKWSIIFIRVFLNASFFFLTKPIHFLIDDQDLPGSLVIKLEKLLTLLIYWFECNSLTKKCFIWNIIIYCIILTRLNRNSFNNRIQSSVDIISILQIRLTVEVTLSEVHRGVHKSDTETSLVWEVPSTEQSSISA